MKRMTLIFILALLVVSLNPTAFATPIQNNGWTWLNPLPQGNNLRALWGSGPNNIYAVGDVGTILHYDGSSWQPLANLPGKNFLLDIWGAGPNAIFAVGENALWHYDGASWQAMAPPSGLGLFLMRGVWGSASNNVYAVGYSYATYTAMVLHYNGMAWSKMNIPLLFDDLHAIWGSDPNHIFAVGEEGVILYYNGHSWQEIDASTEAYLYDVWGSGPNDVYAAGYLYSDYKGVVLHYDGSSWKQVFAIPGEKIYAIWGAGANDIYIVDTFRTVYHFDGHTWQEMGRPTNRTYYLYDVWGTGPDDLFVVGRDGVIAHYDGSQWSEQGQAAPFSGAGIWTDGTHVVAVGGLRALVYDGRQWILYRLPPDIPGSHWLSSYLYGPWGTSWNDLYAVSEGLIWHFDGQTWTHAHVMVTSDDEEVVRFRGIWGSGPNNIYAVGYIEGSYPNNVHVLVHYDGSQWSTVYQASGKGELVAIWGSGPDDIFVAATDGGMLHYDGHAWSQMSTTYFDSVWGSGPNDVWATGETPAGLAAIFHYDGSQWHKVYEKDIALNRIWGLGANNIFAMGATSEPLGISAGLERAVLLHYDGSGWTEMDAPFSHEIKAMHGTDETLLLVGQGGMLVGRGNPPPPVRAWAPPTPTPTPTPTKIYMPLVRR